MNSFLSSELAHDLPSSAARRSGQLPASWPPPAAGAGPTASLAGRPPDQAGCRPRRTVSPLTPCRQPVERRLDATSLQGLAHPLRVQLCDQLNLHGPATATQLAARLGESSGATSYHLRQLEKYGFVEEDPDRGSGRERWWRRVPMRISHRGATRSSRARRPATPRCSCSTSSSAASWRASRSGATTSTDGRASGPTRSVESSSHLRVTADELGPVGAEIDAVITAWVERTRDRQGDGVADVEVQWYSYPVGARLPERPRHQ